jgi:hypothetical protein
VRKLNTYKTKTWTPEDYLFKSIDEIASSAVYQRVCRTDLVEPGFCVIDLGTTADSFLMRKTMVALKRELQAIHRKRTGHELLYLSAERFDQQQTTKLHLDGAPDESLLMLGYEPTEIISDVALADYSRCAFDLGITPQQFLEKHNPMFAPGANLLQPYITQLDSFAHRNVRIVVVNNSRKSFDTVAGNWQGVMHTATIRTPDESKRRVINSTLLGVFAVGTVESVSEHQQTEFMTTTHVRRKGYDKPHLEDDK